ncbi:3-beta hydroxysteroid dehydrogenase [Niabella ginsenosidivorans]|uniref:3-beta hydroxysteroid dehydrogenase n=1 Tax=Niabella ginsenosidivorans TaxID=1176587 RepID=A0A1A9I987_9BACT|nr:3-beta hydroxysteroid dehydrogenase [Niabella ginsenosidivorans]
MLVTGGTGLLGAYILKELVQQGLSVRAIKRSHSILPRFIDPQILNKVEWVEGDILDVTALEEAMQGIDTIIHSAAVVSFSKKDRRRMYKVNVEGTANVVNMALQTDVRRLVYISSVAALGRRKDSRTVNETARWEEGSNNTHYAISKFNAELEAWRGFAEGLEGAVLNPATILGYGNWEEGSCAIFKNVYKEFDWYTNGVNGFADVEDVARAAVMLAQSAITEERFIVCNDNWSFRKLLNTIADGFGKKRPSKEATPFLSSIAWRIEWLKSLLSSSKPLITKESAKVANSATLFDGSKLANTLPGFQYRPLEETILNACRRYTEPR